MSPLRVLVIGGGIGGLSFTHALQRTLGKEAAVTVVDCGGGKIGTSLLGDRFQFEEGPRSLLPRNGLHTLRLIEQLGLAEEVIAAADKAHTRFMLLDGELHKLPPSTVGEWLRSPLLRMIPSLVSELFVGKGKGSDETVYDFAQRRFGTRIAETLFDAVLSGVWAGDPHKASIAASFPDMWRLEQEQGSLLWAMLQKSKGKQWGEESAFVQSMEGAPMYSLQGGLCTLMEALECGVKGAGAEVVDGRVHSVVPRDDKRVDVVFSDCDQQREDTYDLVVSTVQAGILADVLPSVDDQSMRELREQLRSIDTTPLCLRFMAWDEDVIPESLSGFGFLVPFQEIESLAQQGERLPLGVTFDSCSFPSHNAPGKPQTRVTAMYGGARMPALKTASDAEIESQLDEVTTAVCKRIAGGRAPDLVSTHIWRHAIPQYHTGHVDNVERIETLCREAAPSVLPLGASLRGVSVNDIVRNSFEAADRIDGVCVS